MEKGMIFDIQRFSLQDGPGIRTTVFLKGCPLNCIWCHNPESKKQKPQLMLYSARCIGCGECLGRCPLGLHSFTEAGEHIIKRDSCTACAECVEGCVGALQLFGREQTCEEIIAEVERDRSFYDNSGGGMTVSGGEPLMQPELTTALLKAAKEKGISTAIETSGFAPEKVIASVLPYTDLFLFDFKESDPERHKQYTGVGNERILANLRYLDSKGACVVLRCPIIPGCNDRPDHFAAIAAIAEELSCISRVDVEPYHPLGKSKAEALGVDYPLGDLGFPDDELVKKWVAEIAKGTGKPVAKS